MHCPREKRWIIKYKSSDREYFGARSSLDKCGVELKDAIAFSINADATHTQSMLLRWGIESELIEILDDTMTHITHCCATHGCKYGEDDCPVKNFRFPQAYKCETCLFAEEAENRFMFELQVQSRATKENMPNITVYGTCWVPYTNTDCTEGRGYDVPICVCELESTAIRIASHKYVQGSDGPVLEHPLLMVDGVLYGPVDVVRPTDLDKTIQRTNDARKAALARAKELGLTNDEIAALSGQV